MKKGWNLVLHMYVHTNDMRTIENLRSRICALGGTMPPKKKVKAAPEASLGFLPMLGKPAHALGKFISVVGSFWSGCPEADKKERFTSCSEFVMAYPLPFLEYYWHANRSELEPAVRAKLFPADEAGASGANDDNADDPDVPADAVVKSEKAARPPIFDHLEEVSRTLNASGPRRGTWTVKYKCSILMCKGKCDAAVTTYASGDGPVQAVRLDVDWSQLHVLYLPTKC